MAVTVLSKHNDKQLINPDLKVNSYPQLFTT